MLLTSLIFLLLSNSITSRRDKSILYSRVTISILLIATLITYDNLYLLFLAKGIGIFGGLFHITATTYIFHVFIFLITSVILYFFSFDESYMYKIHFILFIVSPKNIAIMITLLHVLYYILMFLNKIYLS
jgi:hypothetical protein